MIHFAWPWIFLIGPLPLLVYRFLPKAAAAEKAAMFAPFVVAAFGDYVGDETKKRSWPLFVATFIWLLLLCAGARPQWLGDPVELPETGRSLMLAIDASGSMEIPDLDINGSKASRLELVKQVAGDFIRRRSGDRVGLIIFGSHAYLQAPLTFDRTTVDALLAEAEIGIAGKETAIGDAIGLAVKRLRSLPEGKAALVLLTDGANTAGQVPPRQAADLAALAGLKIYTIGVGADRIRVRGLLSSRMVNPSADLDEETLQYIASATGGKYFRAKDAEGLVDVYRRIDAMEPLEGDSQTVRPVTALFMWPLGAAFLLSWATAVFGLLPTGRKQHA